MIEIPALEGTGNNRSPRFAGYSFSASPYSCTSQVSEVLVGTGRVLDGAEKMGRIEQRGAGYAALQCRTQHLQQCPRNILLGASWPIPAVKRQFGGRALFDIL
jgi:hypothetical protein